MRQVGLDLDRTIARCRVALSMAAIVAITVDPAAPELTRWLPLTGGTFVFNRYWVSVLLSHLTWSLALAVAQSAGVAGEKGLTRLATAADVLFGGAIVLVTEGSTSVFNVFFVFGVLAVAIRWGVRAALVVTAASVTFYGVVTLASAPQDHHVYLMRAAYLAMTGSLLGCVGQARLNQEERLRALESTEQRERIARSLHDGHVQALAGINLRLESCRELLRRGSAGEALAEIVGLQTSVNREHDTLRSYIRSLAERAETTVPRPSETTRFSIHADFEAAGPLVEHVLHIMLEGLRNVRRHADATSALISARVVENEVEVVIHDDGRGFRADAPPPWSIASRVAEFGGILTLGDGEHAGAHLSIQMPAV